MQTRITGAIRDAERLRLRTHALSGAAAGVAACVRAGSMTPDEIYQLLDVIATDMRGTADHLLTLLIEADSVAANSPDGP